MPDDKSAVFIGASILYPASAQVHKTEVPIRELFVLEPVRSEFAKQDRIPAYIDVVNIGARIQRKRSGLEK